MDVADEELAPLPARCLAPELASEERQRIVGVASSASPTALDHLAGGSASPGKGLRNTPREIMVLARINSSAPTITARLVCDLMKLERRGA